MLVMVHYGVHNGKGIFNIVDYETRRVFQQDYANVVSSILAYKANRMRLFDNLDVIDGKLEVTNGTIENYTDTQKLTVINIINSCGCLVGYTLSTFCGEMRAFRTCVATEKATVFGLTNGYIVREQDSDIIKPLSGRIDTIEKREIIYSDIELIEIEQGILSGKVI